MTAQLLQGASYAREIYAGLEQRIAALKALGVQPCLAAMEAGGNAASLVYIRNKVRRVPPPVCAPMCTSLLRAVLKRRCLSDSRP